LDTVLNNLLKTNNTVERWYNGFNSILNSIHPNILHFIKVLQKGEKINYLKMFQITTGAEPCNEQNEIYKGKGEEILKIKIYQQFHSNTIYNFIRA